MKAVIIRKPGGPDVLQLAERPKPIPERNEVLIKVMAAGINRPDIFQRKGHYPAPKGAVEDIPGLEVAGIIEKCGEDVKQWAAGDNVCVLLTGGGYAEYAVAHAGICLPIPEGWTFEEAASLPETVFTVWHNVFQRGRLEAGENFLVHGGTSGIGITAIQLAKAMGANVFATAGSNEKCRRSEELGATLCINYHEQDFRKALDHIKIDVILDMIGGDYTEKNLSLLNIEGRLIFINGMNGSKSEIDILQIMQKRITITGSTLRSRDNEFKTDLAKEILKQVWPLLKTKTFEPVINKIFMLHEAALAHELVESNQHIGKVVLSVRQ